MLARGFFANSEADLLKMANQDCFDFFDLCTQVFCSMASLYPHLPVRDANWTPAHPVAAVDIWKSSSGFSAPSPAPPFQDPPVAAHTNRPPHTTYTGEELNPSYSSDSNDSDRDLQTRAAKKLLQALRGEKRSKKKKITNRPKYKGKVERVDVDFDETATLDLLLFFVEWKQNLADFINSVYYRNHHRNRTPSAHEAECLTLSWALHRFLMLSDDPV